MRLHKSDFLVDSRLYRVKIEKKVIFSLYFSFFFLFYNDQENETT